MLSERERALRRLLEDANVSHLALLLELVPRDAVHVIGAYAVRAAVGGFARHHRFTLDIDLVLRGGASAVLEAARALGMTAVSHSWGLELKKADPRLEKYYVKLEFGYPEVREADFRYDPELTYEGCVESAGGIRLCGVRIQLVEVVLLSKLLRNPHVPHDPLDFMAVESAASEGLLRLDWELVERLVTPRLAEAARRYFAQYANLMQAQSWYMPLVRKAAQTQLFNRLRAATAGGD